jgi:branched-chain amino acid aminotransferase
MALISRRGIPLFFQQDGPLNENTSVLLTYMAKSGTESNTLWHLNFPGKNISMASTPFDDRDGLIWSDGELIPWRESKLHVLSHALHYASAVFEGERSYSGEIFKLTEHTERLAFSAKTMGFELPFSVAEIDAACRATCEANGIIDGYIRPVAWRGSEMMGVAAQETKIHLAIACWPWPSYFSPEAKLKGIRMKTAPWRRPAPETAPVNTKAAGLYMICTLSKHAVENEGYEDAMMLDWRGQIAEATGANIFIMFGDNKIHTPIPDCFLDGITRRTVIDLAKARGYEVIERVIMPEELAGATEVFLTGTAAEVTPVGSIDEHKFTPGDITKTLSDDYDKLVGKVQADAASAA